MKIYDVTKVGANAVTIGAGKVRLVSVVIPQECMIGVLKVLQVPSGDGGGTPIGFTTTLLKSKMGLTPDTDLDPSALPTNYELFAVMPVLTTLAGNMAGIYTATGGSDGYLFRNIDGSHSLPERKAYLLIKPNGAGDATKWEYTTTITSNVG